MAKPRAKPKLKIKKPVPHAFVLDEIESLAPVTRPMFGCTAVYIDDRIVLILRDKEDHRDDNGVWLATSNEHHESLRPLFPSMREVRLLANRGPTNWQNVPAESASFEEEVLRACELVRRRDPRIGKVPKSRANKKTKTKKKVPRR